MSVNSSWIKKILKIFIIFIFVYIFFILLTSTAAASSYYYDELNVDYYINRDSTFDVQEEMILNFSGEFHGVTRSITLDDDGALAQCQSNPNLQCGGFDFLYIKEVVGDKGNVLADNEYELNLQNVDTYWGNEKRIEVKYVFAPNGRQFSNEKFTWTIKYKIFGGIGFFDTYDLFYWDTSFADREVPLNKMTIRIHFPSDFNFTRDDLTVFNDSTYSFDNGLLTIIPKTVLEVNDSNTVLVKFPKNIVEKPATIVVKPKFTSFNIIPVTPEVALYIDDHKIINDENEYKGIPAGRQNLLFKIEGYEDYAISLDLASGETREVEVPLSPKPIMIIASIAILVCNCLGILTIPLAIFYPIYRWNKKGRDRGGKKTIVPWFKPPDGISPSLLGSLKDEKVSMVDISATIIDTAYRGYVKIKELDENHRNFQFIKLKEFDDLKSEEKKIMDSIFESAITEEDGKQTITTNELKNKFYTKIPSIQNVLYDEMVNKGYFEKRPDIVRSANIGAGIAILVLSIFVNIGLTVITGGIILLFLLFPMIALVILGLTQTIVGYFMPAKTEKGTLLFEQVKGFRMYLYTAERFRMQKLTPEMFEKYLSYAIVFGIEKEWAEKFKDIYKGQPDWYESYDMTTIWTPIFIANSISSMSTVTTNVISSSPQSSSSGWSGGGWSGGGGFSGGFSGGGGGGGGGGAF